MFRTLVLGSNDIARAKAFYDATMGVLGCPPAEPDWRGAIAYRKNGTALMITEPLDGNPASSANGLTVNLEMESEEQVHAWHEAGLANGGTAIEDPPGLRIYPTGNRLYSAYLRDPDGHKFCASYKLPAQ